MRAIISEKRLSILILALLLLLGGFLATTASAAPAKATEPANAKEMAEKKTRADAAVAAADAKRKAAMTPEEAAWEKVLEENLGTFYLPLYKRDKMQNKTTAWDYLKDDPKLPRVLLIGDSISRGYTLPVRHALAGKLNVHRAPENCGPTTNGIKKLDIWLGDGHWTVIHFNFGIHDRKAKPEVYAKNLEAIVTRLEKTGAKLIWASTTPTPPGVPDYPAGQIEKLNAVAAEVMKKHGISIDDLYATIQPKQAQYQNKNDVHYGGPGYELLGAQVAQALTEALK